MYISIVSLIVNDVDRAADLYTKNVGWEKTMDVPMGERPLGDGRTRRRADLIHLCLSPPQRRLTKRPAASPASS